jgi:acetylornithine/N-succinyldiaminopimelate aminotransferase
LLIFDEVQTGIGRTGRWFFAGGEHAGGIVPDIVTIAKSLGSGVPVGACLVSEGLAAAVKENDLGTTFGGGMLAMAAVLATLDAIDSEGMIENARRVEAQIRQALDGRVRSVRGKGCLLGIELDGKASGVHERLFDRGIITGTSSDPNVLRLLPPLCVTSDQIDLFIEAFNE